MIRAEELAVEVEDMPFKGWSTDVNKRVAAELRRLSAVEAELEALKKAVEHQKTSIECQYAKDVGMTEHRCAGVCQYEALARAVMSDNTGKA